MSRKDDIRAKIGVGGHGGHAVVSHAHFVAHQLEQSPMLVARSMLSSATRIRRLRRGRTMRAASATCSSPARPPPHRREAAAERRTRCPSLAIAAHLDGAAVLVDQALHERQADAQTALGPVDRLPELPERLEDGPERFLRDSHAGIANAKTISFPSRSA
jgi:hypothetical protein